MKRNVHDFLRIQRDRYPCVHFEIMVEESSEVSSLVEGEELWQEDEVEVERSSSVSDSEPSGTRVSQRNYHEGSLVEG